jgi:hypothetical protein
MPIAPVRIRIFDDVGIHVRRYLSGHAAEALFAVGIIFEVVCRCSLVF